MKKWIRNSLIITVIFVFVGSLLLGIGYAVGGTNYQIDMAEGIKRSFINEEALREYNIKTNDIRNYADVFFKDWEEEPYTIYSGRIDKTEVEIEEEITSLVCRADACNMLVKVSEDDSYYMESTVKEEFRCYVKDAVLYFEGIDMDQTYGNISGDLILYVPEDAKFDDFTVQARACGMKVENISAENVQCELGAGQVIFDGLDAEQVVIQLGAGEVNTYNVQADKLYAEIGAGEFTLDEGEIEQVEVSVGMGNATLTDLVVDDLITSCAMGNITVLIDGEEDDYDYSAKCVAGNVSIGRTGGVVLGTSGKNAEGDKSITADCAMGNIEIRFLR
jgi:hypothetical protein